MGIFTNAKETSQRIEDNKNAPDGFKELEKVDIKTAKDVITIDKIVIRIIDVYKKDSKGDKVKDENGKYIVATDVNGANIHNAVVFVAFNGSKYFATTSRPMFNQIRVIDDTITLKELGDYPVNGVTGSKVKIVTTPVTLRDGKTYDYPVFIDVE